MHRAPAQHTIAGESAWQLRWQQRQQPGLYMHTPLGSAAQACLTMPLPQYPCQMPCSTCRTALDREHVHRQKLCSKLRWKQGVRATIECIHSSSLTGKRSSPVYTLARLLLSVRPDDEETADAEIRGILLRSLGGQAACRLPVRNGLKYCTHSTYYEQGTQAVLVHDIEREMIGLEAFEQWRT